jgi:hypothetical protein
MSLFCHESLVPDRQDLLLERRVLIVVEGFLALVTLSRPGAIRLLREHDNAANLFTGDLMDGDRRQASVHGRADPCTRLCWPHG